MSFNGHFLFEKCPQKERYENPFCTVLDPHTEYVFGYRADEGTIYELITDDPNKELFQTTLPDDIPEKDMSDYCWKLANEFVAHLDAWFPYIKHTVDTVEWKPYSVDIDGGFYWFYDLKISIRISKINPNKKEHKPVRSKHLYDVTGGGKNV